MGQKSNRLGPLDYKMCRKQCLKWLQTFPNILVSYPDRTAVHIQCRAIHGMLAVSSAWTTRTKSWQCSGSATLFGHCSDRSAWAAFHSRALQVHCSSVCGLLLYPFRCWAFSRKLPTYMGSSLKVNIYLWGHRKPLDTIKLGNFYW